METNKKEEMNEMVKKKGIINESTFKEMSKDIIKQGIHPVDAIKYVKSKYYVMKDKELELYKKLRGI